MIAFSLLEAETVATPHRLLFRGMGRASRESGSIGQQTVEKLGGMDGGPPGEVADLHPAGEAGGDDGVLRRQPSQGGKEALLADQAGNIVMLLLVAERAGHAAAAGVEVDGLRIRDSGQKRHGRR